MLKTVSLRLILLSAFLLSTVFLTAQAEENLISAIDMEHTRASSFLQDQFGVYTPGNAWDGDFSTSWVEAAKDAGKGEWLEFPFFSPVTITKIGIVNGYAYKDYYKKNNRVKTIRIELFTSGGKIVGEDYRLEDNVENYQFVMVKGISVQKVRFTIIDVYPGDKYDDTCISDISFRGEAPKDDGMVLVEGGTFIMGDTAEDGDGEQKPAHPVTVSSFYMNKYEVTQKEFRDVLGFNPSHHQGDNLPVENVTWYDAVAYCDAVSQKEGLRQVYEILWINKNTDGNIILADVNVDWSADGYRLPTEAEWEYAAKGGKLSKGYEFAGANTAGTVAWYYESYVDRPQPVGTKSANELGIHDLSGNVSGWCWDWRGSYNGSSQMDPRGASSASYRVYRGGSYHDFTPVLRSFYRFRMRPEYKGDKVGFRVVRSAR